MIAVLWIIAAVAFLNGAVGLNEVFVGLTSSKATVFQQISARIDVGLSLLVFTVAIGLASILSCLENLVARFPRSALADLPTEAPQSPTPRERGLARKRKAAALLGVELPEDEMEPVASAKSSPRG